MIIDFDLDRKKNKWKEVYEGVSPKSKNYSKTLQAPRVVTNIGDDYINLSA